MASIQHPGRHNVNPSRVPQAPKKAAAAKPTKDAAKVSNSDQAAKADEVRI